MDATHLFSEDYATARRRFREAARAVRWDPKDYAIGPAGRHGEKLAIDVALSPSDDLHPCLVVSSGLHGVEGFLGSAIQVALLKRWADRPETLPRIRVVFLHGLNPYGFSWGRRCDEKNIDPNRNFAVDGYGYAGSPPGYADLDSLLNPKRPPSKWDGFFLKALLAIVREGMPALKQAAAAGQYEYPQGLFYGGSEPSCTNEIISDRFAGWLGGCERIVHLDIHTGLGKWATSTLLIDCPLKGGQREWLEDWFGEDSFDECDSRGVAYTVRGSFGQWCVNVNPERHYLFAGVEFGTYPPLKVLSGMRAENQAHHWGEPGSHSTESARERLKEFFCPKSSRWRQLVLDRGVELVDRAIDGLTFGAGSLPDSGVLVCR